MYLQQRQSRINRKLRKHVILRMYIILLKSTNFVPRVSASVDNNPKLSCKSRSQELMLPPSSVNRILKLDLNNNPYLIQVKPALLQTVIATWHVLGFRITLLHQVWSTVFGSQMKATFTLMVLSTGNQTEREEMRNPPGFVSQKPIHRISVTVPTRLCGSKAHPQH